MAEQLSLHAQIAATINGRETHVDIIATSPQELLDTINVLTGQQSAPAPQPEAQPAPTPAAAQQTQAAPQPTPTAQPGPSAAGPAPAAAATPSATTTAEPASQPQLTLNDVLAPARQLLQKPGGEDTLRQILANHGAEAISQADPAKYGAIKAGIEQALAQ